MDNLLGEFMGMLVLVTFGCGVCANIALNKTCGHGGGWICITAGWAFAVLLGVFTASALGAPQAGLTGAFAVRAAAMSVTRVWITLSHEKEYATAYCVLEGSL